VDTFLAVGFGYINAAVLCTMSTDITQPINFYEIIYLELVDIVRGILSCFMKGG